MRNLKELIAWGGHAHQKTLSEDKGWEEPWPIDPKLFNAVLDMTLQGIGLSGDNIDLDVGTAIFARHTEKDLWNNGYIKQIENKYWNDGLEAVDVYGFNPVQRESDKSKPDITRNTGLQAPRVLKLRTCPQHRLRVVLLHNEDIGRRWCNGTPRRLLTRNSWTGTPGSMRKNRDGTMAVTKEVHLRETERFPEFNVKVIRDEEHTLSLRNRFSPEDICIVPSRHDSTVSSFNGYSESHWTQVSMAIAAAMTCHKVQGLTIPHIYFCLHKVFGFGIPYTAFTRTPFKRDIAIVGVPPRDIFEAIFHRTDDTPSMLERKREDIEKTLLDLYTCVDADIKAGVHDLTSTEEKLLREMPPEEKDEFTTLPAKERAAKVRQYLVDQQRRHLRRWKARLEKPAAIDAMLKVCPRFKKVGGTLTTWKGEEKNGNHSRRFSKGMRMSDARSSTSETWPWDGWRRQTSMS